MRLLTPRAALARYRREEDGVALVEFAFALPMMVLVFGTMIESGRLMLSYQAAIHGVRDATRYLARTLPSDICVTNPSVASYAATLATIVDTSTAGQAIFAPGVTLDSVTPSYACVSGTYRVNPAPVATVRATVTITFPFGGVFRLWGGDAPAITRTITDQARVFGS